MFAKFCFFTFVTFFVFVNGQTPTPPLTEQRVEELIKEWWDNDRSDILDDVISGIDFKKEFENITGVSVGTLIAVVIIIIIVPNIIITLLLFALCYCCGCFSKKSGGGKTYNYATTSAPAAVASKQYGPAVPPKPGHSAAASPSPTPSSGMWPWGKDDGQQGQQSQGVQNQAYNGQW